MGGQAQAGRFKSAMVAPNVARLNQNRQLTSGAAYGQPGGLPGVYGSQVPTTQAFAMREPPMSHAPALGAPPLAMGAGGIPGQVGGLVPPAMAGAPGMMPQANPGQSPQDVQAALAQLGAAMMQKRRQ
jgi:hypothetical protein